MPSGKTGSPGQRRGSFLGSSPDAGGVRPGAILLYRESGRWPMRRTRLLGIVSILSGLLCAACSAAPDVDPDAAISSRSQPGLHGQAHAATSARERLTPVSTAMTAPAAAMTRKAHMARAPATFRAISVLPPPRR